MRSRRGAFTLIELMLVLVLLSVVAAVSVPSLSRFFRGRHLASEVNRFLSLGRFAQSRAVAEGLPMTVWIDTRNKAYGLSAAPGFTELDTNAVEYVVHESLEVDFQSPLPESASLVMDSWGQTAITSSQLGMVRYLPDGFIDPQSPDVIWFKRDEEEILWLTRHANGRTYEIQTNQPSILAR